MEDNPKKAKKLFDKYNVEQNSNSKTIQMQNDPNRINRPIENNINTSKDTGRSNVIQNKNSNKPALVMEGMSYLFFDFFFEIILFLYLVG